jgi:hypothetical protein
MTAKTGTNTNIILAKGTTFGTATAATTGDKVYVNNFNHSRGTEPLVSAPLGSGNDMLTEIDQGKVSPVVTIGIDEYFDGPYQEAQAILFGGDSILGNASSGYFHSVMYNATRAGAFETAALEACVGSIVEYASCTPIKVTTNIALDDYVKTTIDFIANNQTLTGVATNTPATLAAATHVSSKKIIFRASDKFRINAQAGAALADGNVQAITGATITYSYAADHGREIRNVAGNGLPIATGNPPFDVELKVTLRNQTDTTWLTALVAGTEYKADLTVTSSSMAGGANAYQKIWEFPRLELMADPDWNLTNPADNAVTLTFKATVATTAPTGMIGTMPGFRIVNKDTVYLT